MTHSYLCSLFTNIQSAHFNGDHNRITESMKCFSPKKKDQFFSLHFYNKSHYYYHSLTLSKLIDLILQKKKELFVLMSHLIISNSIFSSSELSLNLHSFGFVLFLDEFEKFTICWCSRKSRQHKITSKRFVM